MEKESVGQRFTQLIQQLGLSKNAFAMSLDKTATVIQHLVDERNKPGFDLMCKVFEVYPNVSKDWLLLGKGPMLLADAGAPAALATEQASPVPTAAAKPLVIPATVPAFPEPLFAVSAARLPSSEVPAPPIGPVAVAAPTLQEAGAAPVPDAARPEVQAVAPLPAPNSSPSASAADAAVLTAALHAQYLQHQLALAEQRNQHLLAQQQLMQQMLDLLKRPA